MEASSRSKVKMRSNEEFWLDVYLTNLNWTQMNKNIHYALCFLVKPTEHEWKNSAVFIITNDVL